MPVSFQADHKIPDSIAADVGRIVVAHAHLEALLQSIGFMLLGVSDTLGRVAVRDPRGADHLEMIGELATIRQITFNDSDITELAKDLRALTSFRDVLAHGVWGIHPEKKCWMVRTLKGTAPQKSHASKYGRKRKVLPGAILMQPETLNVEIADIEDMMGDLTALKAALEAQLAPSTSTPLERPIPTRRRKVPHTPKARRSPQKPSRP